MIVAGLSSMINNVSDHIVHAKGDGTKQPGIADYAPAASVVPLVTRTGHGARRTTFSATLPIKT